MPGTDHLDKIAEDSERHRAKMAKRKAVQDAEVAEKTIEKGLLIVHTGPGKGKSTAAFGLALRMLGRGRRVGVVQFIKGAWHTAERDALAAFGEPLIRCRLRCGVAQPLLLNRDVAPRGDEIPVRVGHVGHGLRRLREQLCRLDLRVRVREQ